MKTFKVDLIKTYQLTLATDVIVQANSQGEAISIVEDAIESEQGDLYDEIEDELGEESMDFSGGYLREIDSDKAEVCSVEETDAPAKKSAADVILDETPVNQLPAVVDTLTKSGELASLSAEDRERLQEVGGILKLHLSTDLWEAYQIALNGEEATA